MCDLNKFDTSCLPPDRRDGTYYLEDLEFPSIDGSYTAVLYRVHEWRMGWYAANMVVYRNIVPPTIIINPYTVGVLGFDNSVTWLSDDIFSVQISVYSNKDKFSQYPFILFDLRRLGYAFVNTTYSIPYRLELIKGWPDKGAELIFIEIMKNIWTQSENGRVIKCADLRWHPIEDLHNYIDQYISECHAQQ